MCYEELTGASKYNKLFRCEEEYEEVEVSSDECDKKIV